MYTNVLLTCSLQKTYTHRVSFFQVKKMRSKHIRSEASTDWKIVRRVCVPDRAHLPTRRRRRFAAPRLAAPRGSRAWTIGMPSPPSKTWRSIFAQLLLRIVYFFPACIVYDTRVCAQAARSAPGCVLPVLFTFTLSFFSDCCLGRGGGTMPTKRGYVCMYARGRTCVCLLRAFPSVVHAEPTRRAREKGTV